MNSKISNWLLLQDEKFLSMIKDEGKRTKLLKQLYNLRMVLIYTFLLPAFVFIINVVFMIFGGPGDTSMTSVLLMFLVLILCYFETDTRIRTIRLYELSLAADQKS